MLRGGGHVQAVGDHHAVEAHLAPQHAVDHTCGKACRQLGIEAAMLQMPDHDHLNDSLIDQATVGGELAVFERLGDIGGGQMRVGGTAAVAGEVLDGSGHAVLAMAGDE